MLSAGGLIAPTIAAAGGLGGGIGGGNGMGDTFITAADLSKFVFTGTTASSSGPGTCLITSIQGNRLNLGLDSSSQERKMKDDQVLKNAGNTVAQGMKVLQTAYTTALDALTEIENTIETLEDEVNQYVTLENSLQSQLNTLKGTYGIS